MIDRIENWARTLTTSEAHQMLSAAQEFFLYLFVRFAGWSRLEALLTPDAYCWLREFFYKLCT